jgi:O-antigen ligase
MGFILSILYFATYYLSPAYLFGSLANAHIELIFAVMALLSSLPALMKSFVLKTSQAVALAGLAFAVFLSVFIGMHWPSGGIRSFFDFLPNAFAYFLVCLNCDSKRKLQILVLMLFLISLVVISLGFIDLQRGVPQNGPEKVDGQNYQQGATGSPYFMKQVNHAGDTTYRLQGLGVINDPNDFGQLLVSITPLMFIFWRPRSPTTNIPFVILPVCVLLFGVYLTHSRGALVALTAVAVVASRRRIGTLPAVLVAGGLFAAAMALSFTGGRDISASAGEDRTALWGEGMQLLKTHPLFGVGYAHLWELTESNLTAHNSVVVCAAELGMFGLFFWSLYLFSTIRDSLVIASPLKVSDEAPIIEEEKPFSQSAWTVEEIDKEEINRLGRLMVLSLTGFLVAGWFLSRAFILTLFLLGGMVEAIYEMALRRGIIAPRLRFARVMRYSGGLALSLVMLMYVMIRVLNLMH